MHPNETLIHRFYKAFGQKDYQTMHDSYHADASFSDPVFQNLSAVEAKAMWKMLVSSAKDLEITYEGVRADDDQGQCHWEARYTFSGTGRKVHNVIAAHFRFRNGKILEHKDHFNFWRWSRMALGAPGLLLGWSPYLLQAVRKKVRGRLEKFMKNEIA
ncbi:MAG TPA: nuclear transport factor 2 family protein [Flavitalea sp.]|nr:nuclear transport factor 2 family protein [Flavitalea sp.]